MPDRVAVDFGQYRVASAGAEERFHASVGVFHDRYQRMVAIRAAAQHLADQRAEEIRQLRAELRTWYMAAVVAGVLIVEAIVWLLIWVRSDAWNLG